MSSNNHIFLIICTFLCFFQYREEINYQKIFGEDYSNALKYFAENKSAIDKQFDHYHIEKDLIIPVIFPERIRYSIISNFLETAAVELVYINYGANYIDFSIGDFQLKPSFAEKIEFNLKSNPILSKKYQLLITYRNDEFGKQREERIQRLKSMEFQLIYISAFYDIVTQSFELNGKNAEAKIGFLSTAFNYGFQVSKSEIENHINDRYFPFGAKYKGKQYSYSDVANYYYSNHYKLVFK